MTLDFIVKGQVTITMQDYIKKMIKEYPSNNLKGTTKGPWTKELFKVKPESPKLSKERKNSSTRLCIKDCFYTREVDQTLCQT